MFLLFFPSGTSLCTTFSEHLVGRPSFFFQPKLEGKKNRSFFRDVYLLSFPEKKIGLEFQGTSLFFRTFGKKLGVV